MRGVGRIKKRSIGRIPEPFTHVDVKRDVDAARCRRDDEVALDSEFKFSVESERERCPYTVLEDRTPHRDTRTTESRIDDERFAVAFMFIAIFVVLSRYQSMDLELYRVVDPRG